MSVNRSLTIGIKEKAKHVRIIGTDTQFHGSTPANITLQAKLYGITAKSYAWYKGASAVVGTSQNFVIANNQIATVETYKVVVTAIDGQVYEDTLSISKVQNGSPGEAGRPGKIPVQREWKSGDVYRNNDDVIDYIYHRATNTWWRLKDGYNNVTAGANPTNAFIQLNSLEQLAVNLLLAENANIANFIFKNEKLISQTSTAGKPNISLDGKNGEARFLKGGIASFEISGDFISTERLMYSTTKSAMKLGGGGLQLDFLQGNNRIGRIDTTGEMKWGELYNLMEIKATGTNSQNVGYSCLNLESSHGHALKAKGKVLVEGNTVISAVNDGGTMILGDANFQQGDVVLNTPNSLVVTDGRGPTMLRGKTGYYRLTDDDNGVMYRVRFVNGLLVEIVRVIS